MVPWSLVCPASRGIGFQLTRHLLQTTKIPIVATARNNTTRTKEEILSDLDNINPDRLTVLELDVTDESTISKAAEQVKEQFPAKDDHLRMAFAIPGILYPEKSPAQLEHEQLTRTFAVNTIGPLLLMKHFSGFLPKKSSELEGGKGLPDLAVWLNMSARVGSTSDNAKGGWYSYRASKSAVNSLTKSFDLYLKIRSGDNAMAIAYHPGTVKTDLSKEFWEGVPKDKLSSPEYAAEKMIEVATGKGLDARGRCWDWKGSEIAP